MSLSNHLVLVCHAWRIESNGLIIFRQNCQYKLRHPGLYFKKSWVFNLQSHVGEAEEAIKLREEVAERCPRDYPENLERMLLEGDEDDAKNRHSENTSLGNYHRAGFDIFLDSLSFSISC